MGNSMILVSKDKIDQLYMKLQEFAYADELIKERHIKNIVEGS